MANAAYRDLHSPFNHRLPTCRDLEAAALTTGSLSKKETHKIIYSVLWLVKKNIIIQQTKNLLQVKARCSDCSAPLGGLQAGFGLGDEVGSAHASAPTWKQQTHAWKSFALYTHTSLVDRCTAKEKEKTKGPSLLSTLTPGQIHSAEDVSRHLYSPVLIIPHIR